MSASYKNSLNGIVQLGKDALARKRAQALQRRACPKHARHKKLSKAGMQMIRFFAANDPAPRVYGTE